MKAICFPTKHTEDYPPTVRVSDKKAISINCRTAD